MKVQLFRRVPNRLRMLVSKDHVTRIEVTIGKITFVLRDVGSGYSQLAVSTESRKPIAYVQRGHEIFVKESKDPFYEILKSTRKEEA